jgi:hypothetical protein
MVAFIQFSYTSVKKFLTASSVAALVGLEAMEARLAAAEAGVEGWWRRRNFTLAPVTKHEM